MSINIPDGWRVQPPSKKKRVGPPITLKSHLSGDQDESDLLDSEMGDMSEEEYDFWSNELPEELPEGVEESDYADDNKKYTHTYTDSKTGKKRKVRYGQKGYRIAPGTKKGDAYCARSYGDMKSHNKDCSGKDRNTPMCLSRRKWKCKGKKSSK